MTYRTTKLLAFELATEGRRLAARFDNPPRGMGVKQAQAGKVIQIGINGRTFRMTPEEATAYAVRLMDVAGKLNPDEGMIVEYRAEGAKYTHRATVRIVEVMPFAAEIGRAVKDANEGAERVEGHR